MAALAPYLSTFNAKVAVKTFSTRSLGIAPETVTFEQLPTLLSGLRPTLHTLVGRESADLQLEKIQREVQ